MDKLIEILACSDWLNRLTSSLAGQCVTIYTLHRAAMPSHPHLGTDPALLDKALHELRENGFTFISLEDVIKAGVDGAPLPEKAICFTLDDGYSDQADLLTPILLRHGAKPTFFVITDMLDGISWPWDEKITYVLEETQKDEIPNPFMHFHGHQKILPLGTAKDKTKARRYLQVTAKELPQRKVQSFLEQLAMYNEVVIPCKPPAPYQAMTWDDARKLEAEGAYFAPHSCDHSIFSRLTTEESEYQIKQSWSRLENELRKPVKIFCYPTGRLQDFTVEQMHYLEKQGFLGAVSFVSKPCKIRTIPNELFKLPRIALPNKLSTIKRYASWIERVR
jgi:Polysaccharide deacetylase.